MAADMHELVSRGDLSAMEAEAARNPQSVTQRDRTGLPPLYTAALFRNQRAIDFLLSHGGEIDIFASAYLGRADQAEALLNREPELAKVATSERMTALHFAARAGRYDVAVQLLRHGADVNAVDLKGRTPLLEACHAGPWKAEPDEAIIELLLDHHAEVDLFTAAAMGRTELMEPLLDQNPESVDELNDQGHNALFVAAHNNRFEAVKLLVERGADVSRSDAVGTAALHRTSQQCDDELIRYLIERGARAHLCCHVACGDEQGVRRALAENPDAVHETLYEFNAVGYAIHCWQLNSLRILLENGGRLSEEDQEHVLRISENDEQLLAELLAIPEA